MPRDRLILNPIAPDPEVGRWLAALEEVRADTLAVLADIAPEAIDRDLGDGGDSLGTVLYHVALIEMDWVFDDVLDRADGIDMSMFPFEHRVEGGRLHPVTGEPLAGHLERLARTRSLILDELRQMKADEFHRVRERESIDVTAAWVVFHLIDHEVEHRVRISAIRDGAATRR